LIKGVLFASQFSCQGIWARHADAISKQPVIVH
jgi:hypothetical protein